MKKLLCFVALLIFIAGFSPSTGLAKEKKAGCGKACKVAQDQCKKKAAENEKSIKEKAECAGCQGAHGECMSKCDKKE